MSAAWVASLTALTVAVFGLIGWAARHGWHLLRGTSEFLDEWGGRPARHGLPATPGVVARLAEHEKLLIQLVAETQPNDGSSLHDVMARTEHVMTRTERAVEEIRAEQAKMRTRMEQLETQRHDREDG